MILYDEAEEDTLWCQAVERNRRPGETFEACERRMDEEARIERLQMGYDND